MRLSLTLRIQLDPGEYNAFLLVQLIAPLALSEKNLHVLAAANDYVNVGAIAGIVVMASR
jgi:hypothetical protein